MVYTKFHEVKEVFSFSINDDLIAYCTTAGKLYVTNSLSFKVAWSSDVKNGCNVIWYGDVLYVRNSRGTGANHFFTKSGDRHQRFVPVGRYTIDRFSNMVEGQVIFYGESDLGIRQIGLQEIKSEQFRWLVDLHVVRSFHTTDFVFALLNSPEAVTTIACLSACDGKVLWQLDLRDKLPRPASVYEREDEYKFSVTGFVGMYANKLIVSVTWDPAAHHFIAIDCSTGLIDQYWSDIALKTSTHAQQVLDGSRVLYLHGYNKFEKDTQCVEIDLATGNPIRTEVVQSLLREELVLKDWTLSDGKIYFTAIKNERFPTHIGILDYSTMELLWWQKIVIDNDVLLPAGQRPQVYRDHCYVLDTAGTLHCFKEINT